MVVLQGRDVVVPQSQFGPRVYLQTKGKRSAEGVSRAAAGQRRLHLVGVVVSGVVKVVADRRGHHDEQVDVLQFIPQVGQPDQPVHLNRETTVNPLVRGPLSPWKWSLDRRVSPSG